jgi:hypothetical protein
MGHFSTKSVLFNGTTQYVTMGNVLDFERNQSFTVSGWFKSTTTGSASLVAKEGDAGFPEGWGIELKGDGSGQLRFVMVYQWATNCISIDTVAGGFNDGAWHHFAMVFDGATNPSSASAVSFYVDGASETLAAALYDNLVSNVSNSYDFTLARRISTSSPQWYGGSIDDVSVFNRALSALEVLELATTREPRDHADLSYLNLVGWWYMGDGDTPPTITDHSSSGYNGTLVNSPTIQTDSPIGNALETPPDYGSLAATSLLEGPAKVHPGSILPIEFSYGGGGGGGIIKKYKMRGRDDGAPAPGYVTWISSGSPDFGGSGYPGATPTPVGNLIPGSVVVEDEWEE